MINKPVIFYGAGNDAKNSETLFKDYDPVCFVDKDPEKYERLFMGKRVMPLERALTEFSDALFYVTSSKFKHEILFELSGHVDKSRIINFERGLTRRLSCRLLEDSIGLEISKERFGLSFCCGVAGHSEYPRMTVPWDVYQGTADEYDRLAGFIRDEREKLILNLGQDDHVCRGCPGLEWGILQERPGRLKQLNNNMKSACNCRCFYCNNPAEHLSAYSKEMLDRAEKFDFVELAEGLKRHGLTCEQTVYGWASGEITVSKQKNKVLDYAGRYTFHILSNGIIYDSQMAGWMADTSADGMLNISLDSGTKETFRRIKGVDAFDRVCENLKKYGSSRHKRLELKYIFCENLNDNQRDVDGFFETARHANVSHVTIDRNYDDLGKPLAEKTIAAARRLYGNALKHDIPVFFRQAFSDDETALIKNEAAALADGQKQ